MKGKAIAVPKNTSVEVIPFPIPRPIRAKKLPIPPKTFLKNEESLD